MDTSGELRVEHRGPVLWLTINREERRSAMSHAVLAGMAQAIDAAQSCRAGGMGQLEKIETMAFEESVSFTESQISLLTLTEDAKEGQAAFQQKRKPDWKGR